MYKLEELNNSKVSDLKEIAKKLKISQYEKLKKLELAYAILDYQAEQNESAKLSEENKKTKDVKKIIINKKDNKTENTKKTNKENHKSQKSNPNNNKEKQQNRNNNNFKAKNQEKIYPNTKNNNNKPKSDYDYDFDGIIETEGVIEIMPD
jgi:transcription termination factor Rho